MCVCVCVCVCGGGGGGVRRPLPMIDWTNPVQQRARTSRTYRTYPPPPNARTPVLPLHVGCVEGNYVSRDEVTPRPLAPEVLEHGAEFDAVQRVLHGRGGVHGVLYIVLGSVGAMVMVVMVVMVGWLVQQQKSEAKQSTVCAAHHVRRWRERERRAYHRPQVRQRLVVAPQALERQAPAVARLGPAFVEGEGLVAVLLFPKWGVGRSVRPGPITRQRGAHRQRRMCPPRGTAGSSGAGAGRPRCSAGACSAGQAARARCRSRTVFLLLCVCVGGGVEADEGLVDRSVD